MMFQIGGRGYQHNLLQDLKGCGERGTGGPGRPGVRRELQRCIGRCVNRREERVVQLTHPSISV